jgi:hypothetical protein
MSRHIINSRARAEAVGFCKIEHIRFEKCVFSVSQILSADLPILISLPSRRFLSQFL